jgi:hypothetical protein
VGFPDERQIHEFFSPPRPCRGGSASPTGRPAAPLFTAFPDKREVAVPSYVEDQRSVEYEADDIVLRDKANRLDFTELVEFSEELPVRISSFCCIITISARICYVASLLCSSCSPLGR